MPTTPIPANLPARLDSATLAKYIQDGEPVIVAKFLGVGNTSPYDYRAKDNRAYVFRYDSKLEGHVLRIPLRIWQGDGKKRPTDNLAHAMMDERRMPHPMVVTVEMPKVPVQPALVADLPPVVTETITLTESPPEMGAADTIPAQNVVGLSDEPTAAPAVDWKQPAGDVVYKVAVDDITSEQVTEAAALYDQAFDLVESPKRIKALAALLGVEEDALRGAIALPESKVELANAGWVRRKESPTA